MLKKIGFAIAVLIVVILAVPAVLPSKVHVERTVQVNAPPGAVFAVLSDMNQFSKWSPWYEMEPEAKIAVSGTGVGTVYTWEGKKTGKGSMTITALEANKQVDVRLAFTEPWVSQAENEWRIAEDGAGSKLTWAFDQELPYMMRYFGLNMDSMLGGDFEKGLANFKRMLEN